MFYRTEEKNGELIATDVEFKESSQNPLHEETETVEGKKVVSILNFLNWLKRELKRLSITHVTNEFGQSVAGFIRLSNEEIETFPPIDGFVDHIKTEPHKTEKAVRGIPYLELLEGVCRKRA